MQNLDIFKRATESYNCLQVSRFQDTKHDLMNTKILGNYEVMLTFQRMDLGECPKVHDLALRADYEQASATKDYFYDIDVSHVTW